jgi:hypothetical protein
VGGWKREGVGGGWVKRRRRRRGGGATALTWTLCPTKPMVVEEDVRVVGAPSVSLLKPFAPVPTEPATLRALCSLCSLRSLGRKRLGEPVSIHLLPFRGLDWLCYIVSSLMVCSNLLLWCSNHGNVYVWVCVCVYVCMRVCVCLCFGGCCAC